jgi:hypothetical protein
MAGSTSTGRHDTGVAESSYGAEKTEPGMGPNPQRHISSKATPPKYSKTVNQNSQLPGTRGGLSLFYMIMKGLIVICFYSMTVDSVKTHSACIKGKG